jgi:flagellar basal-body rod modification protein FlgD
MLAQLQHQDPLEPAKNQELMAQMSQIGQLQSTKQLQQTLKTFALQTQIGAAGNLIGKTVAGLNAQQEVVRGLVTSVRVDKDGAYLELDNGQELGLDDVMSIAAGPTAA